MFGTINDIIGLDVLSLIVAIVVFLFSFRKILYSFYRWMKFDSTEEISENQEWTFASFNPLNDSGKFRTFTIKHIDKEDELITYIDNINSDNPSIVTTYITDFKDYIRKNRGWILDYNKSFEDLFFKEASEDNDFIDSID